MSDPLLDTLADMARNRGLRLVRSRVRTAGKRRFGKVGLTDAKGDPVFGMDAKGPVATPEDLEEYLRNLGAKDWGASLEVAVLPGKKKRRAAAANGALPGPKSAKQALTPKPHQKPKPQLRQAKPGDAVRLVELIRELGHEVTEQEVRNNLTALKKLGQTPLVATVEKRVVGLVGVHLMLTVHRAAPVGRIPVLVVCKEAQGRGIGGMLVDAAEQWCRTKGCRLIEVTSNDRRAEAHAFYRHMGFERTSIRFFKTL